MLSKLWSALSGTKTYLVAIATILYGAAEWWSGAMSQDQALAFIFSGSGLAALRHGLTGSVIALAEQLLPAVLAALQQAQKPAAKALLLAVLLGGALAACTPAQLQTVTADVQAACTEYAAIAAPLAAAPDPAIADYLSYGSALCDVATGQVRSAALPNVDAHTAAWLGAITGAVQALKTAIPAAPLPIAPAIKA